MIAGNKALHLTAEGIVQQVELPPMISVIITPVKPSHCSISKNRVECSQNVDSLQSEQAPDVFMSTKQSHRSASECSRDVVSMLSEYAPDDRTSVEQCHRSTSETKVECSGNTVSLRALDDRISSTIKSTETEVPSPLGNQCKPLAVNSVGSIAHENLCTSSSSVKLPLPDDRVTLKFPSIAAILEECTFDIPLLSPIKDPPWLVEQDKNAVDLKSEAIQLKSEYCDVSKEVPGLSLSTTSNTLSSGSRQQQHQTKKRKSNGKASVDEARCSIAKKPCMVRQFTSTYLLFCAIAG